MYEHAILFLRMQRVKENLQVCIIKVKVITILNMYFSYNQNMQTAKNHGPTQEQ